MSDLHELLERFAEEGEPRGATAVFADAVNAAGARRRRRRNRAVVMSASALVLATCGIVFALAAPQDDLRVRTTHSGPSATLALLTHALGDGSEDSLVEGVLRFDAERGCVYLEDRDGTRVLPQWPEGYHARSDPVRIYDAADTLVAEEGKVVTFSGGGHDPAELPSGTETCGVNTRGGLFIMGEPVKNTVSVAVGRIVLTLPEGFTIEGQPEDVEYGGGVTGRSVLIRMEPTPTAEGARCQVAWLTGPVNAFPPDTRPHSVIRIEPLDGSAAFSMNRTEGSDNDLSAMIADTQSLIVDCDDLSDARLVATHITIPK